MFKIACRVSEKRSMLYWCCWNLLQCRSLGNSYPCLTLFLESATTYMGRDFTNVFIATFAWPTERQFLISIGATFQSFIASLIAVFWVRLVFPISQGLFRLSALVSALPWSGFWSLIDSGYLSKFNDFHISSNLICALSRLPKLAWVAWVE